MAGKVETQMVATESFKLATKDGSPLWVREGDVHPAKSKLVKNNLSKFRPVGETVPPYTRRAVEQATAAPGEVRNA